MKELVCKNCGAKLNVGNDGIFVCPNCGTAYVEEKDGAVLNNVTNTNITKIVNGKEVDEAAEYISRCQNRLGIGDFAAAEETAFEGLEYYPENAGLLMCVVQCKTKNYTKLFDTTHLEYLDKAYQVANDAEKEMIKSRYESFVEQRKAAERNDGNKAPKASVPIIGIILIIAVLLILFFS